VRDHHISVKDEEYNTTFSWENTQHAKANISSLRSTATSPSVFSLKSYLGSKETLYSNIKLFSTG
jgi:hypothetical protein